MIHKCFGRIKRSQCRPANRCILISRFPSTHLPPSSRNGIGKTARDEVDGCRICPERKGLFSKQKQWRSHPYCAGRLSAGLFLPSSSVAVRARSGVPWPRRTKTAVQQRPNGGAFRVRDCSGGFLSATESPTPSSG